MRTRRPEGNTCDTRLAFIPTSRHTTMTGMKVSNCLSLSVHPAHPRFYTTQHSTAYPRLRLALTLHICPSVVSSALCMHMQPPSRYWGFFQYKKRLFSIQDISIYHYISRCYHCVSLCIIVDITIYHVPWRHMISMIAMIHNTCSF